MEAIKSNTSRLNRGRNGSDPIYEFEKCMTLREISRIVLAKLAMRGSSKIGNEIKWEEIVIKFHSIIMVEEDLTR